MARAKPVEYSNELFDYGPTRFPKIRPRTFGFAGFKVFYPLHTDSHYDEVAVFLGASYFRAVGQNQNFGLSARGLAVDTGLPKPEEFPYFREFWLEKPGKDATDLTVYALAGQPEPDRRLPLHHQAGRQHPDRGQGQPLRPRLRYRNSAWRR